MRVEKKVKKIDIVVLDDFQPQAKQDPTTLDCLPCCILAMLEYLNKKVDIHELKKNWSVDKYGYEPFEVLDALATLGRIAEIGFYDQDYLGELTANSLSVSEVRALASTRMLEFPDLSDGLTGIIRLVDNHPELLKVQPVNQSTLENWLAQGSPIGVSVGLAEFTETDNDLIHAIVVYGLRHKNILIWDPVTGHLEGDLAHLKYYRRVIR